MKELYRQGDVLLRRVEKIPAKVRPVAKDNGRVILAYGEVTGHSHAVIGDVELLESDVREMRRRFLRVEQEAQVVHEEHDTVTLPPGDYEQLDQVEYAPEELRRVAD